MLFKTRRGLFVLFLLFVGTIYLIKTIVFPAKEGKSIAFDVAIDNVYIFSNLSGPDNTSAVKPAVKTSWKQYDVANPSAMAILLTDTQSHWLGLAHGLTNIGIPFTITTSVTAALQHKVVMVYPLVSGKVFSKDELQAIAAIPRNGGTLLATNVYGGGLNEIFGYDDITQTRQHKLLVLNRIVSGIETEDIFSDVIDRQMVLTDGKDPKKAVPTIGYTNPKNAIISYEDGTGCLVYKDYGVGKSYALGLDIGNYFLRYMNSRGIDLSRAYANRYEASIDIWLRILKRIYTTGNSDAVTIGTVPYNKPFTLIITHDVDFTKSIVNAAQYAQMESDSGIKATYFIQTKYIRDWNDDIFFNSDNIWYLHKADSLQMEIGSHSIAHSRVFSKFATGTGKEKYPDYRPFVKEQLITYNGTILGELRVSKFLLENFLAGKIVRSFRPGHLQNPFSLPQAMEAAGYSYSSSVTAGNVQTNLPYMLMYDREFESATNIVEIPIAVEDELGLPMLKRIDSTILLANQLAKYGGVLNVLIHTDILGQKYAYEQQLIGQLKNKAWVTTIGDFGYWWLGRNMVQLTVISDEQTHVVTVKNKSGQIINGLTLHVPENWHLLSKNSNEQQTSTAIVIEALKEDVTLSFK